MKFILQPTQHLQWFGFVKDVEFGQIEVSPEKLALLQVTLSQARQSAQIKVRTLASIVRRIISISRSMTQAYMLCWNLCEMLTLFSLARGGA